MTSLACAYPPELGSVVGNVPLLSLGRLSAAGFYFAVVPAVGGDRRGGFGSV